MRRPEFAMTRDAAVAFLASAPLVQLCGVGPGGEPIIKTLNGVVVDDRLCFHASPAGEKTSLFGRPVVVNAEETVTAVPSSFTDAELACSATTLFRSVQVHGNLEAIDEPARKARVLQALMEKLQPQGGHRPITADDPGYAASVKGLLIGAVRLDRVDGKAKLAQNRTAAEKTQLLERLWARGEPGDGRAIELIREASPGLPPPPFLASPEGGDLRAWLPPSRVGEAVKLVADEYWNVGRYSADALRRAHLGSNVWVGAVDDSGRLIATARAISDGAKAAWVYDVGVAPAFRGRGWGLAVMRLMLDHPSVRRCHRVLLGTRDAAPFYAQLGFVTRSSEPPRAFATTELVLVRPPGPGDLTPSEEEEKAAADRHRTGA